ncbi:hypothetical protein [Cerasicoccus frondis]|uniref:hypothetical protein n=1 Tax=Cerasicoccus frondis TaxID=490090 RepID=UPI0028528DAF|nr:hypothetical protein [Cerasicoccus frondis]
MKEHSTTANPKLKSLLTLSVGAAALPSVSDAAIVYSGTLNEQIGFGGSGVENYTLNLPGTVGLTIERSSNAIYGNRVGVYNNGGTLAQIRVSGTDVAITGAGPTFNAVGLSSATNGRLGLVNASSATFGAGSFSNQYMAFSFNDSTAGGATRYGWAELSQIIGPTTDPLVTLHSWAYDDTGATIAMGAGASAIPEASTVTMSAFGALALGGIVAWRKRKQATADKQQAEA